MRLGGKGVITAASTYRPPAPLIRAAAFCFWSGDTELRSRKKAPGSMAPATARAASRSDAAVTALKIKFLPATASAALAHLRAGPALRDGLLPGSANSTS